MTLHTDLASLFDLSGRVAIVTGGSRGLGRSMALGFAKAGASVVVASRKLDACQRVVDEVEAFGGAALAVAVSMQESDQISALVDAAVAHFGRIDIVVNNAATVLDRGIEAMDESTFHGAAAVNLLGPMLLVKAALPHLEASGHGSVINIVSIASEKATPGRYLYPPMKAALAQATTSWAKELGPKGIRVNAISPGTFVTDMVTKAFDEKARAAIAKQVPLLRLADADEIVGPALLLASDAGSYLTGHLMVVDGGATL
jgi:NAD(P)-dependent dehydrogenase (short-subunit alcohol dehydrogenase family)